MLIFALWHLVSILTLINTNCSAKTSLWGREFLIQYQITQAKK